MISALQRLQSEMQQHVPNQMADSFQAFGISPGFATGMAKLRATHPPLEVRIAALRAG